jgi:cytochrome P450
VAVAGLADSARVLAGVVTPMIARGVLLRRPPVVAAAEKVDVDLRAVRSLQRLRARYGAGPVQLRVPGRSLAVVLEPEHVRRILDGSPEPFAVANREKRWALRQFQPHGLLVSTGAERADRRRFNEAVLDFGHPVHRLGDALVAVVEEEVVPLRGPPTLGWDDVAPVWWRVVRRVVLGRAARDDSELTDLLGRLRAAANWAYLRPLRKGVRDRFERRLRAHLDRAEPGSLAELVASTPASPATDPAGQVPQWLFAFDAAGIATVRALALLATHPADGAADLRAAVLESVRLWPTTPVVLRDTTTETMWADGVLPAGTALLIMSAFFHRDDQRLPFAHAFTPDLWQEGGDAGDWPLIPFSAGPGECAGRDLVLLVTTAFLAALLRDRSYTLVDRDLGPDRQLPGTLDPFGLRFTRGA